jgi:peptide/nickel transport system substrate-binding protein
VQSDLRQVGVALQPQALEWGTLLDRINDPRRRGFDAVLIGWVTEFKINDRDLFHCDKRDEPFQWVGHCNPEGDRLLEQLPCIVDRQQALPLWQRYQRLISRDQPYTSLHFQQRREGIADRLRNVNPDARGDWVGAREWWIAPGARRGSWRGAPLPPYDPEDLDRRPRGTAAPVGAAVPPPRRGATRPSNLTGVPCGAFGRSSRR